jgi:hypothetical protein
MIQHSTRFQRITLAGICAALVAVRTAPAADPVNVLPHGNFETLDGATPKGWKIMGTAELKTDGANHYLQFTNTDHKTSAWALATLQLDPEWGALRVSARIKATDLKNGPEGWHNARCILNFRTADGKDAGYPQGPLLTADSDWVTQTVTVDIPTNATALHLQPGLWAATGVMGLDDLIITPVEKPSLFPGPIVRLDKDAGFPDGTFETLAADGMLPRGWGEWPVVAQLVNQDNNRWVKITGQNPKAMPTIRTNIRLPPGCKSLRISARMKTTGLKCGTEPWQNARIVVSPCDANARPLPSLAGPALANDSDWTTLETVVSPLPETRYLVLWAGLWQATGVLEIDDVQVTLVE